MKKRLILLTVIVVLSGCGGGSSNDTETSSNENTVEIKTTDIQLLSAVALDPSGGVVNSTSNKYEGKDELKLKIVIKNTGNQIINSLNDTYTTLLRVVDIHGSTSISSQRLLISNLSSLSPNETLEVTFDTNHVLKNTDKLYELTFNDESINNSFSESNYDNNKLSINNVIFEDINLELRRDGTTLYSTDINDSNVSEATSPHTFDDTRKYGHVFKIVNNSPFKFYGDLLFNVKGTPFTINNGQDDFNITADNREINTSDFIQPGTALMVPRPTADTYTVQFSILNEDSTPLDNNLTRTIVIQ